MTNEEILAAAKEAGIHDNWIYADWYSVSPEQLNNFATIIEKRTIEKCAQVRDSYLKSGGKGYAAAIRKLGEQ